MHQNNEFWQSTSSFVITVNSYWIFWIIVCFLTCELCILCNKSQNYKSLLKVPDLHVFSGVNMNERKLYFWRIYCGLSGSRSTTLNLCEHKLIMHNVLALVLFCETLPARFPTSPTQFKALSPIDATKARFQFHAH